MTKAESESDVICQITSGSCGAISIQIYLIVGKMVSGNGNRKYSVLYTTVENKVHSICKQILILENYSIA